MNFRFSLQDLLVPRRLALSLAGLMLLLGLAYSLSRPAVDRVGQQALAFALLAGGYVIIVYSLARIYRVERLRYLTSTAGITIITVFFFTLREDLPAIFLFYLFAILTDSLFWGQNTALYTSFIASLGYATVTIINPAFLPRDVLNIGLVTITFLVISILAGGLVREERARTRELAVLGAIASKVTQSRDLNNILETALDEVMNITGLETGGIALLEEQNKRLVLRVQRGVPPALAASFDEPASQHPLRWKAINTGITIFVENLATSPEPVGKQAVTENYLSLAFIPLKAKERVVGLLGVGSRRTHRFTTEDRDLLSTIGQNLGLAIENARLYVEALRNLREIQSLRTLGEVVIQDLAEGVIIEDAEGLITYANPRVQEMLAYAPGELVGRHWKELVPQDYLSLVEKESAKRPNGMSSRYEAAVLAKDGRKVPVIISARPQFEEGMFSGVLVVLTDITERKRAEEETKRHLEEFTTMNRVAMAAATALSVDEALERTVKALAETLGYHSVAVLLLDPETKMLRLHPSRYSESREISDDFTIPLGKGITGWVAQTGEPTLVPDVSKDPRYIQGISETKSEMCAPLQVGNRVIGVLNVESPVPNAFSEHDLSLLTTIASQVAILVENARLYEETKQLSITDSLTGLWNLRYFYQELGKEIGRSDRYQRPLSLIMFDIDNFKKYNDTYGHLAGDDLLKELARLSSELIRRTDTLARYGGEEFFVILPETAPKEASRLAGRIVEAVRKYRFLVRDGTRRGQVTVSCGVATYPLHADNPKALIQAADAALYKAKETKDRIWTYTPSAGVPARKPEPAIQRRTSPKPSK